MTHRSNACLHDRTAETFNSKRVSYLQQGVKSSLIVSGEERKVRPLFLSWLTIGRGEKWAQQLNCADVRQHHEGSEQRSVYLPLSGPLSHCTVAALADYLPDAALWTH